MAEKILVSILVSAIFKYCIAQNLAGENFDE